MRGHFHFRAVCLLSAICLAACGTFPPNPQLAKYDKTAGYRLENLDQDEKNDELFVVLVFSGGGTRAAAFSYGVLEALRDTKIDWQGRRISLLDEVDVISSVSGGSFPAAYFALRGAKIFDEFPDKFLYRPIQSELIKLAFRPDNLLKLAGASYGRGDLAAEFYDGEIFGAATYAQLIAQRKRPFIILNSTDMTLGAQFSFIQDQFDLLCSDLAGVPLGRAAAASSAFPGGFEPLTFKNYAGNCGYRQPGWVASALEDHQSRVNAERTARAERRLSYADAAPPEPLPPGTVATPTRPYIHLTDGGVADNIGLREPLTAINNLSSSWSLLRRITDGKIKKLAVIVVNAATDPVNRRDQTPNVPGLIDTVTAAATVPLGNYTFDTLEILRNTAEANKKERKSIADCKSLAAKKGAQCTLDIQAPSEFELFQIEVAFEYIPSTADRNWFKNLSTNLELPRETVDKLRAVGRTLLSEDADFRKLLGELNGCLAGGNQSC